MPEVTLVEAVNMALACAMDKDPNVVVFGEDVGVNGGVFRATVGLQQRFGPERDRHALVRAADQRPVRRHGGSGPETRRRDPVHGFHLSLHRSACEPCLERLRTRTQGRLSCPMVLRTAWGGGIHAPEHHSESTEAMLTHIPGLRVVVPSSPEAAYGLLLAAIEDPDPVVFLEPTRIYRAVKGPVEEDGEAWPFCNVALVLETRAGRDALIGWGAMLKEILAAADELAADGIRAEVIDLATLRPYDEGTVLASVAINRTLRRRARSGAHRRVWR